MVKRLINGVATLRGGNLSAGAPRVGPGRPGRGPSSAEVNEVVAERRSRGTTRTAGALSSDALSEAPGPPFMREFTPREAEDALARAASHP